MSSIPERWAQRLVERNFTDRRSPNGGPSLSALADACGVGTTTISNAIHGRTATTPDVDRAMVEHLGPDVAGWLGVHYGGEWTPPAAASLLTERQRKAVEELILAMTERQESDDARRPPIDPSGGDPGGATVTPIPIAPKNPRLPQSTAAQHRPRDDGPDHAGA